MYFIAAFLWRGLSERFDVSCLFCALLGRGHFPRRGVFDGCPAYQFVEHDGERAGGNWITKDDVVRKAWIAYLYNLSMWIYISSEPCRRAFESLLNIDISLSRDTLVFYVSDSQSLAFRAPPALRPTPLHSIHIPPKKVK